MVTTGWIAEEEPDAGPAMPLTNMAMARQHRGPGDTLALALSRARAAEVREIRDAAAAAPDPDERAAGLIARGYSPGLASQLSMKLGDTMAELADEEAKIEKAARRSEHLRRAHERGQISVFDMARSLDEADDGDADRVRLLTRRAESLRRQIGEAQAAISPQREPQLDGVEAAASRAARILAAVTAQRAADDAAAAASRAQLGRDRNAFYAARGRHPFGSPGAVRSTEHTGDDCWVCAEARRSEAAGRDQGTPYNEFGGPAITRDGGYVVSVR